MLKKIASVLIVLILVLSLVSCASEGKQNENHIDTADDTADDEDDWNDEADSVDTNAPSVKGEAVPTFTEDWPSYALPEGFPDLGKVTRVIDSRAFGNQVTIYWNILTEEEAADIVDILNAYLEYDHEWQGYFYSDGLKYAPGTENEVLRVVIRYQPTASGHFDDEDFSPQFYLEISGEALPAK